MLKLKYLISMGMPIVATTPLIACQKDIRFAVNYPWWGKKDSTFFNKIIEELNKKTKENNSFEVKYIDENNDLISTLKKGTSNIAVVTTPLYVKQQNESIIPIIQTLTRAMKFDTDFNAKYSNGLMDDKLIKMANDAQKLFEAKPYTEWNDKEYGWNGHLYDYFYANKDILTDQYRGLIMIQGTTEELKNIKDAWNKKNWNKFRNFGIVIGKPTSGSKYILQEALFRKHFNLPNNKFISFAEDKKNNSNSYISGRPRDIGKGSLKKYHIVFDELGSFAYTNNKNKNYYTLENKNSKIEFLTTTEALKFNIIAINSKSFSKDKIKIMQDTIISLWKNQQDDYGPKVGFNGYRIISNKQKEVIEPYNNIFK